ncbi:hypothetical protein GJ496_008606 [Pomphorhynchus laevis]|nr:hypothetical protein GJ496_008606 [Pomphorhynchus laevis]
MTFYWGKTRHPLFAKCKTNYLQQLPRPVNDSAGIYSQLNDDSSPITNPNVFINDLNNRRRRQEYQGFNNGLPQQLNVIYQDISRKHIRPTKTTYSNERIQMYRNNYTHQNQQWTRHHWENDGKEGRRRKQIRSRSIELLRDKETNVSRVSSDLAGVANMKHVQSAVNGKRSTVIKDDDAYESYPENNNVSANNPIYQQHVSPTQYNRDYLRRNIVHSVHYYNANPSMIKEPKVEIYQSKGATEVFVPIQKRRKHKSKIDKASHVDHRLNCAKLVQSNQNDDENYESMDQIINYEKLNEESCNRPVNLPAVIDRQTQYSPRTFNRQCLRLTNSSKISKVLETSNVQINHKEAGIQVEEQALNDGNEMSGLNSKDTGNKYENQIVQTSYSLMSENNPICGQNLIHRITDNRLTEPPLSCGIEIEKSTFKDGSEFSDNLLTKSNGSNTENGCLNCDGEKCLVTNTKFYDRLFPNSKVENNDKHDLKTSRILKNFKEHENSDQNSLSRFLNSSSNCVINYQPSVNFPCDNDDNGHNLNGLQNNTEEISQPQKISIPSSHRDDNTLIQNRDLFEVRKQSVQSKNFLEDDYFIGKNEKSVLSRKDLLSYEEHMQEFKRQKEDKFSFSKIEIDLKTDNYDFYLESSHFDKQDGEFKKIQHKLCDPVFRQKFVELIDELKKIEVNEVVERRQHIARNSPVVEPSTYNDFYVQNNYDIDYDGGKEVNEQEIYKIKELYKEFF